MPRGRTTSTAGKKAGDSAKSGNAPTSTLKHASGRRARRREEEDEDDEDEDEDDDGEEENGYATARSEDAENPGSEEVSEDELVIDYNGNPISLRARIPIAVAGTPLSKRLRTQGFTMSEALREEEEEEEEGIEQTAPRPAKSENRRRPRAHGARREGVAPSTRAEVRRDPRRGGGEGGPPRPVPSRREESTRGVMTPGFRVVPRASAVRVGGSKRAKSPRGAGRETGEAEEEEEGERAAVASEATSAGGWSRPARGLIAEAPARALTVTYDADSEDEAWIESYKGKCRAAHVRMCSMDELERGFEALERAEHVRSAKARLARDFADVVKRTALTAAKAEFMVATLQKVAVGTAPPVASAVKLNRDAEHYARTKSRGGPASSSSSSSPPAPHPLQEAEAKRRAMHLVVARAIGREESDAVVHGIHAHWSSRRAGGLGRPLLHFAPNEAALREEESSEEELEAETPPPPLVLTEAARRRLAQEAAAADREVFARLRYYREDLERVRLLADTMRRREKLKKEIIRAELETLVAASSSSSSSSSA